MKQIVGLLAMVVALATCAVMVEAQQPTRIPRIGYLSPLSAASDSTRNQAFGRGLRELGYIEGKNVATDYRYAAGELDRLPGLADQLVSLKVDVIVASSAPGALAAKNATRTIPIVFAGISDPVRSGIAESLAKPAGNATGFSNISSTLVGKRLELLKETIPKLSHAAILWNPKSQGSEQSWNESQVAARELGLQLYSMQVSSADKYESVFKQAIKSGSTGVAVQSIITGTQKRVAELAAKNRLPAIYPREDYVESGGLISYGPDRVEPFSRAAVYVDKILKGAKPAELPVEQPSKFELVINLEAAKQIGLTIPPNVLARADKVIK